MFYRFSLPPAGLEANAFAGIWCQGTCHYFAQVATKTDAHNQAQRERVTQWASSSQAQHWAVSTKEQCTWSHLPSTWLGDQTGLWSSCFWHVEFESRIKAEELLPQLKTLSSRVSELLLCSDAASQSDILWQPLSLSAQGSKCHWGTGTRVTSQSACSGPASPIQRATDAYKVQTVSAEVSSEICSTLCTTLWSHIAKNQGKKVFIALLYIHPSTGIPQALLLYKKIQVPKFLGIHSQCLAHIITSVDS